MDLEFLKELYFHEWERKQQLATAANMPVVILTALGSGSIFLLRSFSYGLDPVTALFVVPMAASLVFQSVAIYRVIRSLRGYWFQRLPETAALRKHHKVVAEYHRAVGNPPDSVQTHFDEELAERLAEATDVNRENNRLTAGSLEKATNRIVGALIFAALSFVPHLAQSIVTAESRSAPVVANRGGTAVSKSEQQEQPAATQPSQETPTPPPPPMPANQTIPMTVQPPPPMPANQEVRKGGDVREKR